jgi:hypothetical protein
MEDCATYATVPASWDAEPATFTAIGAMGAVPDPAADAQSATSTRNGGCSLGPGQRPPRSTAAAWAACVLFAVGSLRRFRRRARSIGFELGSNHGDVAVRHVI